MKEPKVGDIVIIYKDGVKRNSWKMAIIEDLIQGKDDPVRGAKVRVITKGKVVCLNRPMQMLYTLEVRESVPELPQHLKSQVEQQGRKEARHSLLCCGARRGLEDGRND